MYTRVYNFNTKTDAFIYMLCVYVSMSVCFLCVGIYLYINTFFFINKQHIHKIWTKLIMKQLIQGNIISNYFVVINSKMTCPFIKYVET